MILLASAFGIDYSRLFDPSGEVNDALTRHHVEQGLHTVMRQIVAYRYAYDYNAFCDERNNPRSVIDEGLIYADIIINVWHSSIRAALRVPAHRPGMVAAEIERCLFQCGVKPPPPPQTSFGTLPL